MATTALRFEAQLSDAASIKQANHLLECLDLGKTELLREALTLLSWAVRETRQGRMLASVSATGGVRELSMPILERARFDEGTALGNEEFLLAVKTLTEPRAPSQALRDLMVESRG